MDSKRRGESRHPDRPRNDGTCGKISEFAEFLAGHGIYVLGNDHLGHGKTAAAEEDRGYFGDHAGAVSVIRDMRRVTVHAQRKYPGVPIFFWGTVWGRSSRDDI